MSRFTKVVNSDIIVYHGNDHAIGRFLDVTSKKYADSGKDEQGEGYIFEYSDKFKIGTNLAGLQLEEIILENQSFKDKLEEFYKTLE